MFLIQHIQLLCLDAALGRDAQGVLNAVFLVSLGWPCVSGRASPRTSGSFQIFVEKKASASERVIIVLKPGVS